MSMSYLSPISELRGQINRIFSDFAEEPHLPSLLRMPEVPSERAWLPPVEISETDKDVVVKAQLPGLKPEEIQVETVGNTLILSGEFQREQKQEEKQFHRSEFQYGSFRRSLGLPDYAKTEACQAEFKNGILELRIPKVKESRAKRIEVQSK